MTLHIEAAKEDIAEVVLMPGDPLRAKYIAEKYLDNYKLVNKTRNMFAYTGEYKGKKITVFSSGMGIPSMGIYSCELFKFYDVEKIIRIGTCGTINKDVKMNDIVLSSSAYTNSTYGTIIAKEETNEVQASSELNNKIEIASKNNNLNIKKGCVYTSDVFDLYFDISHLTSINDKIACEMEAFALLFNAKYFNKEATCLLTVVDSKFDNTSLSIEERQTGLDRMIKLALDSTLL